MTRKAPPEKRPRKGWAEEREPLDEKPAATVTTPQNIGGWAARAEARSGPKFAPGLSEKFSNREICLPKIARAGEAKSS